MNTRTLTSSHLIVNGLTTIISLLGIGVIIYYIQQEIHSGIFIPNQFFLYFTVQTGILFAIMQSVSVYTLYKERRGSTVSWQRAFDACRFCVTLYAVMIAPIYWGVVEPYGTWRLDNLWVVIHLVVPVAALASWLVLPSRSRNYYSWTLTALLYPVLFVAISVIRGALDNWYPYDFLDHTIGGWMSVIQWVAVLSVGVIVIGSLLVLLSRLRRQ